MINNMVNKIPVNIIGAEEGSEELIFEMEDGSKYTFYHSPDCCEAVSILDICGDVKDLLQQPLLQATEVVHEADINGGHETWTFYIFRNVKGTVTVRWYGSSNGYYSEEVSLREELDEES